MDKRIAIIGDIHGCIDELQELHSNLRSEGIDTIYHLGDLIDRGPDSPAVVSFCRENEIQGVMGNHESSLLSLLEKSRSGQIRSESITQAKSDRMAILGRLNSDDLTYIKSLPKLHVLDRFQTVLVHGGMWPGRELWEQDRSILYLQVINPQRPHELRWTAKEGEYSLAQSRAEGFAPWPEFYDGPHQVVYGHTVVPEPSVIGKTVGIDTGCVYGGKLTAAILPGLNFLSVEARRAYAPRKAGWL